MKCIMTVRFHIFYDSKEIGPIHPQRGLRQGILFLRIYFLSVLKPLVTLSEIRRGKEKFMDAKLPEELP